MHGNFHIVSYKDYPLIPDKKQALPINFPISDIRYQLVFEANDDIKCEELLLAWRAKPNGLPHKQTLPRWFYVDELVPLNDGSNKIAALQYKGHTKHQKLAPFDIQYVQTSFKKALVDNSWSELLPTKPIWLLKEHRELSRNLASFLLDKYESRDFVSIKERNFEAKLSKVKKKFIKTDTGFQLTISGYDITLCWEDDLPIFEHPSQLKEWVQESSNSATTAYIDLFESYKDLYVDEYLIACPDLLAAQPANIEESLDTIDMLIRLGSVERLIWVIRMGDSNKALVASLDLSEV
jgi:hypothetical protein